MPPSVQTSTSAPPVVPGLSPDSVRRLMAQDSAVEAALHARYDSAMAQGAMAASPPHSLAPLRRVVFLGAGVAIVAIVLTTYAVRRWRDWRAR